MFTMMIVITVLTALYGLAWHDQPAHEPVVDRRAGKGQGSNE